MSGFNRRLVGMGEVVILTSKLHRERRNVYEDRYLDEEIPRAWTRARASAASFLRRLGTWARSTTARLGSVLLLAGVVLGPGGIGARGVDAELGEPGGLVAAQVLSPAVMAAVGGLTAEHGAADDGSRAAVVPRLATTLGVEDREAAPAEQDVAQPAASRSSGLAGSLSRARPDR